MTEFELIKQCFSQGFPRSASTVLGIGDDCSIVQPPAGFELVQSIDTQVADIHFPATAPADLIAERALRCAASDLAAMGALPQGFHLALTLPAANETWLNAFSQGLKNCAHDMGLELLGGDTTRGSQLVISLAVQGFVPSGHALRRSGAKVGDDIWVSDRIGNAALALPQVLNNPANYSDLAHHYYFPQVQLPLGQALIGLATACMDISDGLLQDAGHLAHASGVTLQLHAEKIPTAAEFGHELWLHCLTGGDDYQLLFTAPAERHAALTNLRLEHSGLCCIGKVVTKQNQPVSLLLQGEEMPINEPLGFQHF